MTREEFIGWCEERFALTKNDIYDLGQLYDEVTKPHWISVKDELPPKKNEYVDISILVLSTDGNDVYKSRYIYQSNKYLSGWFTYNHYELNNITHWMPMPEAPTVAKNATVKKGGEE